MALTIDNLEIQIQADSTKAANGIDNLAKSLGELQKLVGNTNGLAHNLTQIANAIQKFSAVGKINMKSKITQLSKLNELIPTLGGGQATTLANNLRDIADAIKSFSSVPKVSITPIANGIKALNDATVSMDTARLARFSAQMQGIANGLSHLNGVGSNRISSIVNAVRKIPEITTALDPETIAAFSAKIRELTEIMTPLGTQMDKIARGFNALPRSAEQAAKANDRLSLSFGGLMKKLSSTAKGIRDIYYTVSRVADFFGDLFNESNEYIEALNLFEVSMGDASDAAMEYAETVSDLMGIDIAEWITKQGTFMRTMVGFGVLADEAEIMSKNLTQLGYDLASFFNTSTEEAFDKLQSGMTGQIKGLKDYGLNLSVAALQETAWRLGIEQSVRTMTEAQKAQLRYITLLQNSTGILGDMAKTIITPANSLRVLNAQIDRTRRAWGNLVSVIAVKVIPWVMAFAEIIEEVGTSLAEAWGFELPELPENDLKISADTDELEEANKEAEELKKQLMGFDELNILKSNNGDENKVPSYSLGIDLPEYDFLGNLEGLDLEPFKKGLKDICELVGEIALAFLTWKIADSVIDFVDALKSGKLKVDNLKLKAGITLMVTGFVMEFVGAYDLGYEGATLENIVKTALGAALGIAGSLLVFGTGPVGWAVGIGMALTIGITGFTLGYNKREMEEDLKSRFGEIVLDAEEMLAVVENLTTTDVTIALGLYIEEVKELEGLKTQVESAINKLERNNFRISIGIAITQEEYAADVDAFVNSVNSYLEQKEITAVASIRVLFGEGSELESSAISLYGGYEEQLRQKGEELKELVAEGFKDGEWIPDKYQEALDLQKEIQEVYDKLADVEFRASVADFGIKWSGVDLTSENFDELVDEAQTKINEQIEALEGARLEALKVAIMQYDVDVEDKGEAAAKKIYDETVAAIEKQFNDKKIDVYASFGSFSIGGLTDESYKSELDTLFTDIQKSISDAISGKGYSKKIGTDLALEAIDLKNIYDDIWDGLFGDSALTAGQRDNIQKILDSLKPTIEEQEKLLEYYRGLGVALPENLAKGVCDTKALQALAGSTEALYYTIGATLSGDKESLAAFLKAEDAGKEIPEEIANGITDNLTATKGPTENTVQFISDTLGTLVIEYTPTVKANMEALGIAVSEGVYKGAAEEMETQKKSWKDWAIWPWNWFKEANEINSPSKLFESGGKYIAEGLYNGVSNNTLQKDYESIFGVIGDALSNTWDSLSSWWEDLELPAFEIKKPQISWSSTPASGTMANILSALGLPTSLPKLNVEWYASGGFPTMGQMFIARESGPELVGRIGNKNAVANNDQITAGIASAVYSAMMAAQEDGNNSNGGTARIIVQIGEKAVGEASVRYINGQIVQTGMSPINS